MDDISVTNRGEWTGERHITVPALDSDSLAIAFANTQLTLEAGEEVEITGHEFVVKVHYNLTESQIQEMEAIDARMDRELNESTPLHGYLGLVVFLAALAGVMLVARWSR